MGWSILIGSISGIRVRIHLTFLLFLIWVGAAFWSEGGQAAAINGLAYILLLFLCVVLHEFGHILMARRYGSQTVDVILLPIGGVARMKSIPEKPAQELAVALAGPCVNLVIALLLIGLAGPAAILQDISQPQKHLHIMTQLAAANIFLAVFNLLPAFPMDGGRALRAVLSHWMGRVKATSVATRIGHILAFVFGLYGFLGGQPLLMLIALFVYLGATAENNATQVHYLAQRLKVSDAMITQFASLPVTSRIGDAATLLIHSTQHDIPIVDGVGKLIGLLTRSQIVQALHDQGRDLPVVDVMRTDIPAITEQTALEEAFRLMDEHHLPAIAVASPHGRLVGMVTLENLGQIMLLGFLRPVD